MKRGFGQTSAPPSRAPNDRCFCGCWGGSIYNLREDSFTDYVETYQYSIFNSHS